MLLIGTCTFTNAFNQNMYIYENEYFFSVSNYFFSKNFMCIFLNHIVFVEVKKKYCINFFFSQMTKWRLNSLFYDV